MFFKKEQKENTSNGEISPDVMEYKNALEMVRFDPEVEHDPELVQYFDEAIDKAEKNESILTINSKLNYQLTTYIQTHHFKAPHVVGEFMKGSTGDITAGLTSVPVTWGTIR